MEQKLEVTDERKMLEQLHRYVKIKQDVFL